MKAIWCMFSVDNYYDQPDYNLVRWWSEKPSMEAVARAMGVSFPATSDEVTLALVKIWQGQIVRHSGTDYRIEEVPEGEAWETGR